MVKNSSKSTNQQQSKKQSLVEENTPLLDWLLVRAKQKNARHKSSWIWIAINQAILKYLTLIKYTALWLNVSDLYLAKAIEALLLSQVGVMEDLANEAKEIIY